MLLEEADHRGVLLHGLQMPRELDAQPGGGACVGDDRRGAEYEGAQARDEGFQEMTSAWGTGARRAPQSGPPAGEPGAGRSCLTLRASVAAVHKTARDDLRNLHTGCHERCRPVQRETPLSGRFGGCGTGTRTPTSGARIRRPTIRRSRRARQIVPPQAPLAGGHRNDGRAHGRQDQPRGQARPVLRALQPEDRRVPQRLQAPAREGEGRVRLASARRDR